MKRITIEKIDCKIRTYIKNICFGLRSPADQTVPVFIMGYGRSGSTMLLNVFERDLRAQTFGEDHPSVAKNFMLDYNRLSKTVNKSKASVMVLKPILNSFEISKLLAEYPNGYFLWLIRDYKDVVASALKKFGPVVADYMKDFIERGTGDNWISQTMPSNIRDIILSHIKNQTLETQDWMALVWWATNYMVMDKKLAKHNNVIIIRYRELVNDPGKILNEVYKRLHLPYNKKLVNHIHQKSIGKGKNIHFNHSVNLLCSDLEKDIYTS
ncbi:MAG: sulfotransferase [Thermodesulfobacteriota bacterium]